MRELIIDNFAGAGGASLGIEQALGMTVDIAINHDAAAIEMHRANHPDTYHYCENIWKVDPVEATKGNPVGLAWFSPDCTHHSRAKGGKPVKKQIRGLAWVVVRWAKKVRPRVIILENVSEFQEWGPLTKDNQPDKKFKGKTFGLWVNRLRGLGYKVEWRELTAADYGAPTIRKRLFLIARCDGRPIIWPKPTHAQMGNIVGLKPYRTAAECIDWSIPCPSIFLTKKEIKQQGLNIRRPLANATLRRIARGIQRYVVEAKEPFIVRTGHYSNITGEGNSFRGQSAKKPLATICATNDKALVIPSVVGIDHRGSNGDCIWPAKSPLRTLTRKNRFVLVEAFLSKYYNCSKPYSNLHKPMSTVTGIDHNALITSHLTKFYKTNIGSDIREPVPTITATGQHIGEVRAFLIKYYGTNIGHGCKGPLHTVTSKARLGLVTVEGQKYQIADIGLRMLQPRELARGRGFPDSYILTGTKTNKTAKIGNSVCPVMAKVLVNANVKLQKVNKKKVG